MPLSSTHRCIAGYQWETIEHSRFHRTIISAVALMIASTIIAGILPLSAGAQTAPGYPYQQPSAAQSAYLHSYYGPDYYYPYWAYGYPWGWNWGYPWGWGWPIGVSVGFGGCFNCGFRGGFFHPRFRQFGFGHPGFFHPGFGHFGFAHAGFGGGFHSGGRR